MSVACILNHLLEEILISRHANLTHICTGPQFPDLGQSRGQTNNTTLGQSRGQTNNTTLGQSQGQTSNRCGK